MAGPIIIIEDDPDDLELLREVFNEINIQDKVKFFDSCMAALDYLMKALIKPLIIISDINLPAMTGSELKQKINETEHLFQKSIPFVFLTTNSDQKIINQAYKMMIQGFFVKPSTLKGIKETIQLILNYWSTARHSLPAGL